MSYIWNWLLFFEQNTIFLIVIPVAKTITLNERITDERWTVLCTIQLKTVLWRLEGQGLSIEDKIVPNGGRTYEWLLFSTYILFHYRVLFSGVLDANPHWIRILGLWIRIPSFFYNFFFLHLKTLIFEKIKPWIWIRIRKYFKPRIRKYLKPWI